MEIKLEEDELELELCDNRRRKFDLKMVDVDFFDVCSNNIVYFLNSLCILKKLISGKFGILLYLTLYNDFDKLNDYFWRGLFFN